MKTRIMMALLGLVVVVLGNACSETFVNELPEEVPPDYGFYKQIGNVSKPASGMANQNDECASVAVDSSGNIFCGGRTASSLGAANAGLNDILVMKFDPNGAILWTRQIGTTGEEGCNGIAVDSLNNVVCVGSTSGTLPDTDPSTGGTDAFIIKLNGSTGATMWTKQLNDGDTAPVHGWASVINNDTGVDVCNDVAIDVDDNIACVGHTLGSLFEANTGTQNGFIAILNTTEGAPVAQQQFGGTTTVGGTNGNETFTKVRFDVDGDMIVAGSTTGAFIEPNGGSRDAFVFKLNKSNGLPAWVKQFGATTVAAGGSNSGSEEVTGLTSDSAGNVLLSLTTTGNMAELGDSQDIVVTKLAKATGAITWMTQLGQVTTFGDTGANDGNDSCVVAVNSADQIFCAGHTTSSMGEIKAAASTDAVIIGFTSTGQIEWLHQWGQVTKAPNGSNTGAEQLNALAAIGTDGIVAAGWTSGDFAEGNAGGRDILLIKMSAEGRTPPAF